jgi:hypothetical protein
MVRDWLRKRKDRYYYPLNVLPKANCIAVFCLKLLNFFIGLRSDDLFTIFLTLALVNIRLRIIPTLALVTIT